MFYEKCSLSFVSKADSEIKGLEEVSKMCRELPLGEGTRDKACSGNQLSFSSFLCIPCVLEIALTMSIGLNQIK